MKIRNILIIITGILALSSCSRDEIATDQLYSFIKFYGMGKVSEGKDVLQLSDGCYMILGTCTYADSGTDIFLSKIDKYGNEIWKRNFGTKYNETGICIQSVTTGGYILLGATEYSNGSGKLIPNIFLVKTNNEGNAILWKRNIGGDTSMIGNDIKVTESGGFIITGNSVDADGSSLLTVITDAEGNMQYVDLQLSSISNSQIISTENGYLSVGTISSTVGIDVVINLKGESDICITHTNDHGKSYFIKNLGGSGKDAGECLKKLYDGSYLCLGTDSGTRIRLTKFGLSGDNFNPGWEKLYSSKDTIYNARGLEITSDNEYAIAGYSGTSPNQDLFFLKTDSTGKIIYKVNYSGNGNQTCSKIIKTSEGGFAIVGTNENAGYSVITLVKTKANGGL